MVTAYKTLHGMIKMVSGNETIHYFYLFKIILIEKLTEAITHKKNTTKKPNGTNNNIAYQAYQTFRNRMCCKIVHKQHYILPAY